MPRKTAKPAADVEDVVDKLATPAKKPRRRTSASQAPTKVEIPPPSEDDLEVFPKLFLQPKKRRGRHFHKPNSLIHNNPQQVMTPNQQKISNIFLRHVQQNGISDELTWQMSKKDLLGILNIDTRNEVHIEKVIDQMMSIKVKWDMLEESGSYSRNIAVIFPYTKIEGNTITFKVEPQAARYIASKGSYTLINFDESMKLTMNCAIPLYELASRYLNIGHTRWFKWENLRDMLLTAKEIPKNALTWSTFNERYLSPAVRDVRAQTSLYVDIETERYGVKVINVRVTMYRNKKLAVEKTALNASSSRQALLTDGMRLLNLPDLEIKRLMSKHSEEDIEGALHHTRTRVANTRLRKISVPAAFFKRSLRDRLFVSYVSDTSIGLSQDLFPVVDGNNNSAEFVDEVDAAKEKVATRKRSSPSTPTGIEARVQKMHDLVNRQRLLDVKVTLAEMSAQELDALYAEYNAPISTAVLHMKSGRVKAGVLISFQTWYAKKLYGEITDKEIVQTLVRQKDL
ncbi:RepB family plasmid replication initiator protein [Comamonas testosteroni]|uniref:RepB family plasmid replication initiator protein n=1 Tax=Comamonas testosteroni TaxID=285 RepID=UPI0009B8EF93|nr:RepB family plasmid replication initiator protein [Comamonas testosteroni]